jgi:PKD repeat protein
MRLARRTTLVLVLGLALSLVIASSAWAVTVNVSESVVNPNEQVTATADLSDLTAAEQLLVSAVHFRFTGNDDDERTVTAAPYSAPFTYTSAGIKTITLRVEFTVGADETDDVQVRVNAAPRAVFSLNVRTPNVGQTVRFDAGPTTDDQEQPGVPGSADLPNSA